MATRQYLVVLEVDEDIFLADGDDSIETACTIVNDLIRVWKPNGTLQVRPASEVIAA